MLDLRPRKESRLPLLVAWRIDREDAGIDAMAAILSTSEDALKQLQRDGGLPGRSPRNPRDAIFDVTRANLVDAKGVQAVESTQRLNGALVAGPTHSRLEPVEPPINELGERDWPRFVEQPELCSPLDIDLEATRITLQGEPLRPVTAERITPAHFVPNAGLSPTATDGCH
jgi:hypothetical protein